MTGQPRPAREEQLSRRGFLITIAASVAAVVGTTGGQAFGWLRGTNLFAPRVMGLGPQQLPVNRTAAAAAVVERAVDPSWRLTVINQETTHRLSRTELQKMAGASEVLPIACVEGWSTSARWSGVRLRDLLTLAGAIQDQRVRITSLEPVGGYRVTTMGP